MKEDVYWTFTGRSSPMSRCSSMTLVWFLIFLIPLCSHRGAQGCPGDQLPRQVLLARFKDWVLGGLGMDEPPAPDVQSPAAAEDDRRHQRLSRTRRALSVENHNDQNLENSQIILFPSSDSPCARSEPAEGEAARSHFTYYFQPSVNQLGARIASAQFWFYAGEGAGANSSSAPLFLLTSEQQLLQGAEAPSQHGSDGWVTYRLERSHLAAIARGPFALQVRCWACGCDRNEPDNTPFLHLRTQATQATQATQGTLRPSRAAIPWSPSAIDLLQRHPLEGAGYGNCHREELSISFDELGWGSWIIHPKVVTFRYCHGNCSAAGHTAAVALGITQCCAPVPETMKSLRVTTTSDGGYSLKYEILPNIIPEECSCF